VSNEIVEIPRAVGEIKRQSSPTPDRPYPSKVNALMNAKIFDPRSKNESLMSDDQLETSLSNECDYKDAKVALTPRSLYIEECKQLGLPCIEPIGIVRHDEKTVDISSYSIGNKRAKAIATPLSKIYGIQNMNLANNRIDEKTAAFVFSKLPPTTRYLNVSENKIGVAGIKALAHIIEDATVCLDELDISSCSLSGNILALICKPIESSHNLYTFNLSRNQIGANNGPSALSSMLRGNTSITNLNLSWCNIGGAGAELLMKGLKKNVTIKWLDFSYNSLASPLLSEKKNPASKGNPAKQLCAVLASNKALTHLNVSFCKMGKEDIEVVAKGLNQNRTLLGLVVTGNQGYVDPRGFLHVKNMDTNYFDEFAQNILDTVDPNGLHHTPNIPAHPAKSFARRVDEELRDRETQGAENNDWILEGWNAVNFLWIPGKHGQYMSIL
jgi:hypothetical protein